MRKALIVVAAFLASAIVGVILTLLIGMVAGTLWTLVSMRNHPGLGAVAGGISEIAVMMVPVLWGVIGSFIVLHRLERKGRLS